MAELIIDGQLQAIMGELSNEEYEALEKSLIDDHSNVEVYTWNGVLYDGTNRYRICTKHSLPFVEHVLAFTDRGAAMTWAINRQIARRNVSQEHRKLMLAELVKIGTEKTGNVTKAVSQVAKERNVGEATVWRAMEFSTAVENGPKKIKDAVAKGERVSQKKAVESLKVGKATPVFDDEPEPVARRSFDFKEMSVLYQKHRLCVQGSILWLKGLAENADEGQDGAYTRAARDRILDSVDKLKAIVDYIDQITPAAICPKCNGKKCGKCHQLGWVTKRIASNLGLLEEKANDMA